MGRDDFMLRNRWALAGLAFLAACGNASSGNGTEAPFAPTASPDDFAVLVGDDWEGELTYLDPRDGESDVTVPVELLVGQNERTFELHFTFPDNEQAGGRAEITVSDDGRRLNDETLIRRMKTEDGLMLVAQAECQENDEPGACKYTYLIGDHAFEITKMIKPQDDEAFFRQNHYSFTRP
ncbi:hypothetical protein D1223_08275 [Henriciella mobilis]|uniref:Lipoprotein n=2 Tax=Henriciella mobilis TaxID=2305467 RepID=A0A399RGA1_9PROT|nr:hypothetical protein D1223_08275 [Henriciella mobilis]